MLNKHPNSNCIYNEIRWTEGDREKSVKCLDERGRYRGLIRICIDLNLIKDEENSKHLRLEQLRELIMEHPAFNNGNTHFQRLASEHGFNVLFCPKYHFELNPIEGVWCFL
ncbi:unnamed protein product [Brachionus calyciflorus]|uniref:Tc1-like transposase DDE domain-containing protein n=1 Tax=Brachionus calyciflorus TaxID=104777 RepID=A0A814J786_9BILA|nr:unnamed protein product [Brachionus calyciflorus]